MSASTVAELAGACMDPDSGVVIDGRSTNLNSDQGDDLVLKLREHQTHVVAMKGGRTHTDEAIMTALDVGFSFPWYFGWNWDAVNECLKDVRQWIDARGFVCVVFEADLLEERNPKAMETLLDVFRIAGDYWRDEHRVAFKLVLL